MQIISKESLEVNKWSGGTTTELYIYPEDASYASRQFDFRISTATVETETSEFTALPGFTRLIMSLDKPLDLWHDDQHIHLNTFDVDRFDGGCHTVSKGQVTDFNLMFNNLYAGDILYTNEGTYQSDQSFVYALDNMKVSGFDLKQGDFLVAGNQSFELVGACIVIQVKKLPYKREHS